MQGGEYFTASMGRRNDYSSQQQTWKIVNQSFKTSAWGDFTFLTSRWQETLKFKPISTLSGTKTHFTVLILGKKYVDSTLI